MVALVRAGPCTFAPSAPACVLDSSADCALELAGVFKRYRRRRVLDGLVLSVRRGEIVGLLGPNGSGKTTTLRIAAGLLWPDAGEVRVAGRALCPADTALRARIGYLPERVPLYDPFTVRAYLEFVAAARGLRGTARAAAVARVLAAFDLEAAAQRVIGQLSKGFRQRIGLAEALVGEPDVLLLDEPTNGLDPFQVVEARAMIRAAAAHRGVVFSTHILQEVAALCTRVVFLRDGRLIDLPLRPAPGQESLVAVLRTASGDGLAGALEACDPRCRIDTMTALGDGLVQLGMTIPDEPGLRGRVARLLANHGELREFGGAQMALEALLAAAVAREEARR